MTLTAATSPVGPSSFRSAAERGSGWLRARRAEDGAISLWVVLVTSVAFTALLGLVYDGGRVLDARLASSRAAAQAARVGADELSAASSRSGGNAVEAGAAGSTARSYLRSTGLSGAVRIDHDRVTVTVSTTIRPTILGALGVAPFTVTETETACGIKGDQSRCGS